MSLDNIQLDIVVTLQGSQAIRNTVRGMQDVARAASDVRQKSQAMVPINLSQIKSWDSMTAALSEVERKYDAVFRAGAHMSMMGQGLIDSSERIARAAMGIVDAYEDYDLMLRRGAVALNVNEEWQGKLDEAIQKTARTVGLMSPDEVAEGYYIWGAAAGVVVDTQKELDDITNIVRDTMVATAMAGGTLEGNLNGVYGVLAQFNLPAEKASDVVKTLGLMTERTAAQFPDLINSLSYIGPLAESLGITFEDVTSILGLLADAGQKGSRAGRGLSMVIEGLSAPSGPAGEALDGLVQRTHGLSAAWEDIVFPEGEFIGMRDLLIEMALAAEDMTDAERGRFYATAFTNNATRALIPLIEDQIDLNREAAESGREITSVLDQQKYATEGAAEFFENMRAKAIGSITAIKGRLEASFFPILQDLALNILEMAGPVINWLGDITERVAEFVDKNPELVQTAIKIAAITAAAMAGAGILFALGGAIMYLIGNLGVFFQGIGRILGPFGVLIGLFVGFGVAVWNNVGGIQDAIANFASALGELWSAITGDGESFRTFWEGLWSGLQSAAEWIVTQLAEVLNGLADAMRGLSENEAFTGFMSTVLDLFLRFRGAISTLLFAGATLWAAGRALAFFTSILKILTGYTAVKGVILGIAGAIMHLSRSMVAAKAAFAAGGIVSGLQTLAIALGGGKIVAAVSTFIGLLSKVRAAVVGVTLAMMANPLVLAIAALIGLGILLWQAWENNWLGIRDIVNNVVTWFQTHVAPVIGGVVNNIIGFFVNLWTQITTIWTNVTTWVGQAVALLVQKFNELLAFFAALPGNIATFIGQVWTNITTWIGEVIAGIGQFLADLWTNFTSFLADLAENWDYYLGYILGYVIGFIASIIANVIQFGADLIEDIIEFLSQLPGKFAEWLGSVWTTVSTWFVEFIGDVGDWMSDMIAKIVDWISKAPGRFARWLGEVWTGVSTWFTNFIADVGEWMSTVISNITDWISKAPGRFMQWLGEVWNRVSTWFSGFIGDVGEWASDTIDSIISFFKQLPGKAVEQLGKFLVAVKEFFFGLPGKLWKALTDVGKAIVDGIWRGIQNAWEAFWDSVHDFFSGIVDGVKDSLGIDSPSKVFAEIGEYMIQGLSAGISSNDSARRALGAYTDSLVAMADGTTLGFSSSFDALAAEAAALSVSSDGTKTVRIEMDLTSSDGSYSDATLEQLKAALNGSDLVRALEHMAEAG